MQTGTSKNQTGAGRLGGNQQAADESRQEPDGAGTPGLERRHDPDATSGGMGAGRAAAASAARRPATIRRRYWVDSRSQLPILLLGVGSTLFFVVMFNLTLLALTEARREAIVDSVPAMESRLLAQDMSFHRRIYLASAALVLFVNGGLVVLTQRSSGPIHRVENSLRRVAAGDLTHTLHLRRRDHFGFLADEYNRTLETLRQRTRTEIDLLEHVAAVLEAGGTAEREGTAAALARLVEEKRRMIVPVAEATPGYASPSAAAPARGVS
jgi:methyl-accepting chemotaxis protein